MKHTRKLLLATTALAVTAGAAAAGDIDISGSAEMGVTGGSGGTETQFHQDVDVTFKMSGETDGGLTFGTEIDLDEMDSDTTDDEGIEVYISGAFGRLGLGDTDGALDWAVSEVPAGPGSIADNQEHDAWYGSHLDGMYDGQILRYDHTVSMGAGSVGFAASLEMDDTPDEEDCYPPKAVSNAVDWPGVTKFTSMQGTLETDDTGTDFDETERHCVGRDLLATDLSDGTNNHNGITFSDPMSRSQIGVIPSDNVFGLGVKFDMPAMGGGKLNFGVGFQSGGSAYAWDMGKRRNEGVTVAAADHSGGDDLEDVLASADPVEITLKTADKSEVGISGGIEVNGFSVGLRMSQISNAEAKYVGPVAADSEQTVSNAGNVTADGITEADTTADTGDSPTAGLEGNTLKTITTNGGVRFSDARHIGIGASYTSGSFGIGVNYGVMTYDDEMVKGKTTGTGLSLGYELGRGLSAQLGYGRTKEEKMDAVSTWSAGLAMKF